MTVPYATATQKALAWSEKSAINIDCVIELYSPFAIADDGSFKFHSGKLVGLQRIQKQGASSSDTFRFSGALLKSSRTRFANLAYSALGIAEILLFFDLLMLLSSTVVF
ncbi:unnamed protein product [Protopolystoma xenopodis]|uniref:Uncharacterized protein n=1 Tax=Protopolystoma xenopodis TaxID=117903 RepID=A0A3S5FGI8_9PLAT|nr:unnamed protein product [Protopolystoma xenopodis]